MAPSRSFPVLAVLLVAGPVAAQEEVRLRWRVPEGEVLRYRLVHETVVEGERDGRELPTMTKRQVLDVRIRSLGSPRDGVQRLELTVDREQDRRERDGEVTRDVDSDDGDGPFRLAGKSIVWLQSEREGNLGVETWDGSPLLDHGPERARHYEQVASMFIQRLTGGLGAVPEDAVSAGDSWSAELPFHLPGLPGAGRVDVTHTVASVDADGRAVLDAEGSPGWSGEYGQGSMRIEDGAVSGRATFSSARRRILHLERELSFRIVRDEPDGEAVFDAESVARLEPLEPAGEPSDGGATDGERPAEAEGGSEGGGGAETEAGAEDDGGASEELLGHVEVGQTYVYQLPNDMKQEWLVEEVADASVTYEITTIMDMGQGPAPIGEPQTQRWKAPELGEATEPLENLQTHRDTLTIDGVEFDVLVTEVEQAGMASKAWTPVVGDVPTFPGVIKTQTDGKTTMKLVSIERPE